MRRRCRALGRRLFKRGAGVVVFLECEEYNTVACERDGETKVVRRCAGQPDRLLSQRPAGRRMALGKAHHCQEMQSVGRCGQLLDHSSDRCAFLQTRAGRRKITICPRQDAISQEGPDAGPRWTGLVVNRRGEKCASLTPMPAMEPNQNRAVASRDASSCSPARDARSVAIASWDAHVRAARGTSADPAC